MSEKCGNQIKFCTGWANGQPTYETFECVKDKRHVDDHETYGTTGTSHHHWRLIWWSGDWDDSKTSLVPKPSTEAKE